MAIKSHHVVYSSDKECWAVKKSGATRVSGYYNTKQEAVNAARTTSRKQNTEMVVHGKNGQIQSCDSHGNDPCPPKG